MKYCRTCGADMVDNAVVCIRCGCAATGISQQAAYGQNPNDAPSKGFAILGFLIPVLGFILWLAWNNSSPQKAKSCGKGALWGTLVFITAIIILFVMGVSRCQEWIRDMSDSQYYYW